MAPSGDIDGHRHLHCSCAHTEMLNMAFELGTLWDEYGIIDDVIVSCNLLHLFIKTYLQSFQPLMNAFPHAYIHELLTLDLLHQLIKGAFKDHIISLVMIMSRWSIPHKKLIEY